LWLSEKSCFIDPKNVLELTTVWLQDTLQPNNYQFYVSEILYSYESRWKIRNIKFRHHHPSEYTQGFNPMPPNTPILKLMLDIYFDDFGTFRNVYHSLGGIYLQFCNMPFELRKQLKNHFVLSFVPFGGEFDDTMKPIINEIKALEKGTLISINGQDIWIIAALGVVTADLPQGNDLADTKRHGGNLGCRSCLAPKEQLNDFSFDIKLNARYHHLTNDKIHILEELIQEGESQKIISEYCTENGLRTQPSILNQLTRDRHLQTPQDAYHAIAGKIQRFMECTFSILNPNGETAFLNYWRNLETPAGWYRLPNPIKHRRSFMFSDILRLAMVMPFLLWRFLTVEHIKDFEITSLQRRLIDLKKSRQKKPSPAQVINTLISCWVAVAKAARLCFSLVFTEQLYLDLKNALRTESDILIKVVKYLFIYLFFTFFTFSNNFLIFTIFSFFQMILQVYRIYM